MSASEAQAEFDKFDCGGKDPILKNGQVFDRPMEWRRYVEVGTCVFRVPRHLHLLVYGGDGQVSSAVQAKAKGKIMSSLLPAATNVVAVPSTITYSSAGAFVVVAGAILCICALLSTAQDSLMMAYLLKLRRASSEGAWLRA
ncbi:hypothetical protein EDB19DRAFT_1824205 [Suillus lakei]|nr:hypothetical protein EDB19DRAFT_1824205 [Suillus lakei]